MNRLDFAITVSKVKVNIPARVQQRNNAKISHHFRALLCSVSDTALQGVAFFVYTHINSD